MKRGNGGTDRDEGVEKGRGRGRGRVRKRRDDRSRRIIRQTEGMHRKRMRRISGGDRVGSNSSSNNNISNSDSREKGGRARG